MLWRKAKPQPTKSPRQKGVRYMRGSEGRSDISDLWHRDYPVVKVQYTEPGWWYSDLLTVHWLWERRKQHTSNQKHLEQHKEWWAIPTCSDIYTIILPPLCRHILVTFWPQLLGYTLLILPRLCIVATFWWGYLFTDLLLFGSRFLNLKMDFGEDVTVQLQKKSYSGNDVCP